MASGKIDQHDRVLLELLQQKGRTTRSDLAKAIGKSVPAVSDRMRRLEESGVIEGYYAHVNARKIGMEVMAFVVLQTESSKFFKEMLEAIEGEPQILECHAITGAGSHILKVYAPGTEELEELLARIQSWPGVNNTRTSIVLSSPKFSTCLPVPSEG